MGPFSNLVLAEMSVSLCNRILSDIEELYRFADGRLVGCTDELNELAGMQKQLTGLGKRLHGLAMQQAKEASGEKQKQGGGGGGGQLSEYDVLTWIGTGTFGVTKLCRHKATGMYYCMKIMSKQRIFNLKQQDHVRAERAVLSMVRHPFLCSLHSSFQDEYNLYIVMEYVQGGELFAHIRASANGLSQDIVQFYGAEIVLALEYLHSYKIVHRDLKPENLLLDKRGHIRVADFGFAKIIDDKTFTVCVPEDHEMLTNKGFMDLNTWLEQSKRDPSLLMAGYNQVTQQIVFEKPLGMIVQPSEARWLVEFAEQRQGGVNYQVTQEHQVFVGQVPKKVRADEVLSSWEEATHVTAACNGVKQAVAAGQSFEWLTKYGEWIAEHQGPMDDWVWRLSAEQLACIVRGLSLPFSSPSSSEFVFQTKSAELRDQVVRVLLLAGYAPSFWYLSLPREFVVVAAAASVRPTLCRSRNEVVLRQRRSRVWCFTMPSGFLWVRRVLKRDGEGRVEEASQPVVTGNCGTPEYIAGEIISGRGHGLAVDYWSLGVLMYEMLAGSPPFRGETNYKLFEVILACAYKMPAHFSPEAASLVSGLLQSDPTRRLGAMAGGIRDIKEHIFFKGVDWNEVLQTQRMGPLVQHPGHPQKPRPSPDTLPDK